MSRSPDFDPDGNPYRHNAEQSAAAKKDEEKTTPINRVVLASKPIYEILKHAGLIPSQNAD